MLQIGSTASLTSLVHQMNAGAWLLVQVSTCAVVLLCTRPVHHPGDGALSLRWSLRRSRLLSFTAALSPWGLMALMAIGAMLALSLTVQATTPIYAGDDKMYHASRVIYWIQHQTVFPFDTHNVRQTITPFGSELFFLWPVLLTKVEVVGRLVFWLAYPLAATGQYLLLRSMRLSRTISLVGVLILISTPLVATSAIGLKPELWSVVSLIGVAYCLVSICLTPNTTKTHYFLLGIFAVISVNIRAFPVAMLPSLVVTMWWTHSTFSFATRLKILASGMLCAGLMSSLLIPLVFNSARYHHPLGPTEVRHQVAADFTPRVIYTHAVRFAFLLMELPDVPTAVETRNILSTTGNQLITDIGANVPLTWENDSPWPGRFTYALPEHAKRFSLAGLLWIPILCLATLLFIRNVVATWPRVKLTAVSAQTLMAIPLLAAVLFGARWIVHSEVPARFLVGPYSLWLSIAVAICGPYFSSRKFAHALAAIIISYSVYQPISTQAFSAIQALAAPITINAINQPFEQALDLMPLGSRILFVGNQDAPDYPLFSPGTRYSNAVIPWGLAPFDAARMRHLIESEKATHILIQDIERESVSWLPPLNIGDMLVWLAQEPGLKEVPLSTPYMRLFETTNPMKMDDRSFQLVQVPAQTPLVTVGKTLWTQVGIHPATLKTPWPVESLGTVKSGFLWMGQGPAEGLEVGLWSRQDRAVDVRVDVSPGPSLTTQGRRIMLLHDGLAAGDVQTFKGDASIVFPVTLHAGHNVLNFLALDAATVKRMPNGDERHLVIGLHSVRIDASPKRADAPPALPEKANAQAQLTSNDDFGQSAKTAIDRINRHQQLEGYWLTTYTREERFERPKLEMNTFVTSMMVDLLSAAVIPTDLGANMERARAHLGSQIEADGLVRYHGRPDAAAMRTLGLCPITPDTDDTALVWRIAPGANALRASALAQLMDYRTPEGLYKTWLGQSNAYQCINPGADPNPADVGIQMHMLMLLAQTDPAAARTLCGALRQAIDQDRLWVYYRRAPLVPLLRQADLKAAGCTVQLPPSRIHTDIPDQLSWVTATQILQRMDHSSGQLPTTAEVREVLQALSKEDFAPLRLNPPMLYHNDLSASVRRFYWSEDIGYAIWLRLYSESVRRGLLLTSYGSEKGATGGSSKPKPQ